MITEEQIQALQSEMEANGENQAQMAYRILEEMIVTLKLPPGSKISEKALNRSLGFGRTPLREALQRLAIEGSVKILPRSGVIVSEIDLADQLNMIEVRRELEKIIAGRAARLAMEDQRRVFSKLAEDFDRAAEENDSTIFIETDREFNALSIATAQNKYVAYAIGPIEAQTRRFWYLHFKRFGDLSRVTKLHAHIARAIAANDEAAARDASDRLIDYVEEYTRKTLQFMGGM
ncbi:putative transcriptional regulator, GntR family [Herminiimonas arsenicoxydans]|uniref:Transcriptional regulator, GntR family n=1 Tax=Herminiimonas arsenicoxydans TaxID=204773 RepID=A4G7V0_HERAR|nr:putative transcriptional regulator, GntR family [Herminiimonas arsenicoxydans]